MGILSAIGKIIRNKNKTREMERMIQKSKRLFAALLCIVLALGTFMGSGLAEQQENTGFAIGTIHQGFRVYQIESIDYMGAELYFMEHEKSGAHLVYAACDDPERAFGVAFRTQCLNDEGMAHVFEHSALSGSDKYPDSNLFFSMVNQTYSTFLNAETRQLATLYPTSSLSEEQLFANMDVYMSGVLHPILLKDERAMMREAWHYNLDDPTGDITISGVVYSEMAANYGVMQYAADNQLRKLLFPGSYSANSVGGDPAVIPDMTYQELLDFHAKYYHPSNMLLMLYGDFSDVERFLLHLDTEYLSAYDRIDVTLDDPFYQPAEGYREQTYHFPAMQNTETDNAAVINYAFVLQDPSYLDYTLASIAITSFTMETSPLKQRMSQEFPFATFSVTVNNDTVQPTLRFSLINAEEKDAPLFKQIIDEAIPTFSDLKIDESVINALVNRMQYNRATTREHANGGVNFFKDFADSWSKTGRPDAYMDDVRVSDELQKCREDGSIDTVLGRLMQASPSSVMLVTIPEPGQAEKNSEALAKKLADMKADMTEEDVQALVDQCADYNAWIENNAKVSMIDQVKVVDGRNLPDEYDTASVKDETVDGVRYLTSEVPNADVFQVSVYLDAQGLPFESLLDATLAVSLLGKMNTQNYSKEALQTETLNKTTSVLYYLNTICYPNEPAHQYLRFSGAGLTNQIDDTFKIIEEVMLRTEFTDYSMIRETAAANVTLVDLYTTAMPDIFADSLGRASVDPDYYVNYYTSGSPEYKEYFQSIARMNDDELAQVAQRLKNTLSFLLNRPGAVVTAVGSAESIDCCLKHADSFLAKTGNETHDPVDYAAYSTLKGNAALVFDTSVAYNYIYFNMDAAHEEATGSRMVAQAIVTDMILMPELRFRGNAYGASNAIASDISYLRSYRDPNVATTYETFRSIPEKLRALEMTEEQLSGYITAAYSSAVAPRGPISMAEEAIEDILSHREPDHVMRTIQQIKATTLDDIHAAAGLYERFCTEGTAISAFSETMYSQNSDLFETVIRKTGE